MTDLHSLESSLVSLKATIDNGLKMAVAEQKTEIAAIRGSLAAVQMAIVSHTAKDEIVFVMLKKAVLLAISIGFGIITFLVGVVGYLLATEIRL